MALNALGTNAVTDSWVMKERDIQIFWKSIKFPCNDTQKKEKIRDSNILKTETDLD